MALTLCSFSLRNRVVLEAEAQAEAIKVNLEFSFSIVKMYGLHRGYFLSSTQSCIAHFLLRRDKNLILFSFIYWKSNHCVILLHCALQVKGEAEAFAIEAKAKAEAEQMAKKADAWKEYREAAVVDMVLETLPKVWTNDFDDSVQHILHFNTMYLHNNKLENQHAIWAQV